MKPRRSRPATLAAQRGQALILTSLLVIVGFGALLFNSTTLVSNSIANQQSKNVEIELAKVRDALIGWSASRTPPVGGVDARPGDLPCPDINPLDGYEDGTCVAGALGRAPWKTLGIPEPKDAAGETLWYAIAGPFRKYNPSIPLTTVPITSDTLGNITVYQNSTATTLTTQAAAVIFAPGAALGTQDRSTTGTMACSAPLGTYTRNLCASNYLETWDSTNNATINGPFIQAQLSAAFNDRLLVITNADLMPVVEQRVAREMMALLNGYYDANGIYPWADLSNGDSNGAPDGYNRGRFPCGAASPNDWGDPGTPPTPSLPNWLTNGCGNNGWPSLIFYAVARAKLQGGGSGCSSGYSMCSAANPFWSNSGLTILCQSASSPFSCAPTNVGSGDADVILITPGASDGSPRSWPSASYGTITGYFEDFENRANDDDRYDVPSPSNDPNHDRMFIMR